MKEVDPNRMTKERAARMIQRFIRRHILKKRERVYRQLNNEAILLTKKWHHNRVSGAAEIMCMYVTVSQKGRCHSLRFTIFDYVAKVYIYNGVYDQLNYLDEFEPKVLLKYAKASLDQIAFEKSPFRLHIVCL